jgi:hypothetical protein
VSVVTDGEYWLVTPPDGANWFEDHCVDLGQATPRPSRRYARSPMAERGSRIPLDYDALERWTRVGYERGMKSRTGVR